MVNRDIVVVPRSDLQLMPVEYAFLSKPALEAEPSVAAKTCMNMHPEDAHGK